MSEDGREGGTTRGRETEREAGSERKGGREGWKEKEREGERETRGRRERTRGGVCVGRQVVVCSVWGVGCRV